MQATTETKTEMETAFALVEPKGDWRAEITAFVTKEQMFAAKVTVEDILCAIEFFTATFAKTTHISHEGRWLGTVFQSVGYRRGPAGP
jgi:hypothetical protein